MSTTRSSRTAICSSPSPTRCSARGYAEDVVQEAWLRWADVDQAGVVDPRAYLVTIVTRQALNRLRTLARRREEYVGEWLPEPLLTSPHVAEDVELAESVSIAMLTVLETLGPTERAVFVLREVFDMPYDEIAEAVGKTSAAVRQIAHRGPPTRRRPPAEDARGPGRAADGRRALPRGDPNRRQAEPARRDGARRRAGLRRRRRGGRGQGPVEGVRRVVALFAAIAKFAPEMEVTEVWLNGAPAARFDPRGELDEHGRIARIYAVRNPYKLARLDAEAALAR
jgi:RNA polymerase sigma factor (sigma-70 family)